VGRARDSIAAIIAATLASGCFFTDNINQRPSAEIQQLNAGDPLYSDDLIELSADHSTDPDGDPLSFEWQAFYCPTADPVDCESIGTGTNITWSVKIPGKPLVRVELTVRDEYGASAKDEQTFAVLNDAPTVSLTVQGTESPTGGYTIGRPLSVFAEAHDGDVEDEPELTLEWTLFPAPGSVPEDVEWVKKSDTQYDLRPDVAGLWRVDVSVADPFGGTDDASEQILIEVDKPPCIDTPDPPLALGASYIVDRDAGARRFAVLSVTDELDPYPLSPSDPDPDRGEATFSWWLASPATGGVLTELAGHTLADYTVDPALYAPGDALSLRAEVADRVPRALPCADGAATCSIDDDGCLQRVTWEVQIR